MSEIIIDAETAMKQAMMTAEDYLSAAMRILRDHDQEVFEWTLRDAIELTKVMAKDFHTTMMCIKMQENRDAIYKTADMMEERNEIVKSFKY